MLSLFFYFTIMPYCKISWDLKLVAINLYDRELVSLNDILDCVGFSEQTFYHVLSLWRETGNVIKHTHGLCGRPCLLVFDDFQYLLRLVCHHPDWFLNELADLLHGNRFISVHFSIILQELARAGYSIKKLKQIAAEHNEDKQAEFVYCMAEYTREQLSFLNETSKDEKTPGQHRGWEKKGRRAKKRQVFVCGHWLSGIGLLTIDGIVTSTVIEGSMMTESFCEFLKENVVYITLIFYLLDLMEHYSSFHSVHHFQES